MSDSNRGKARERTRRYRERMRARGLRRVELWLPDTSAPGFAEEIARQCRAIRESEEEAEVLAFIEQVAYWPKDEDRSDPNGCS